MKEYVIYECEYLGYSETEEREIFKSTQLYEAISFLEAKNQEKPYTGEFDEFVWYVLRIENSTIPGQITE